MSKDQEQEDKQTKTHSIEGKVIETKTEIKVKPVMVVK